MRMTPRITQTAIVAIILALAPVHEIWGCYPNPPCTPAWTSWFITRGKEPSLDIQCPELLETCINVPYDGAAGGPITVSISWSKKNGEKQRQDPTGCANPSKQTAPLIVPQPTITWYAYSWGQGEIASGSGTTASFMFAPLHQPDGVLVCFSAQATINDPDLGTIPLWDVCEVGIQVWKNVVAAPTNPGPPPEIDFGIREYVESSIRIEHYCYPVGGMSGFEESYSGWVNAVVRDKFTYDFARTSACGDQLIIQKTFPTGWEYSFSVSVAIPGTPFSINFDINKDEPDESQIITWLPKSCYQMHYAWIYKREIKQVNSATFTGEYYRRVWDCFGQTLSEYHVFPQNQDASALLRSSFLGYTANTAQKYCCPNQVTCP